ncbi:hypothetical protein F4804DRAFT_135466 [Jackrogersella minutella]|nr:hypothetical protein F4804DRAFT_135466 [Jackrogersella minutella]
MTSPLKKQPEAVADKVLKRVEVSKIARRLQGRLALASFKTKHGWEDLTLDKIEPKVEEEIRRKRRAEGDTQSDSSSIASDQPYPNSRALMSSPLKASLFFSDAIGSSNGSTGRRKRTYDMTSFDRTMSSPTKRSRTSNNDYELSQSQYHQRYKMYRQQRQSSPKLRRQQHFTTSTGPDISFFQNARPPSADFPSPNFAAPSDDDEDLLPAHSFMVNYNRSSPPRTPPMRNRAINRRGKGAGDGSKAGEEGAANLLLYLATSPSPTAIRATKSRMDPPSTPPQKNLALPSSMMTTPGGGNMFPTTPGQAWELSDFVNITPSPAQKAWKTPRSLRTPTAKTPLSGARRRLTFDEPALGPY